MSIFRDARLLWCSNSTPSCVRKPISAVELVRGHSVLFVMIAKLMETFQMSTGGWIGKQCVGCPSNHKILPDHRKAWDGMVRRLHCLSGHESERTPGDGDGQGRLGCCSPWGGKESDTTERLNNNNKEEWGKKKKEEWSNHTGFSTDEPWKHYARWKHPIPTEHTGCVLFHLKHAE